jgi:ATP-binding cassette subfamily C (CFTR/MRP) protein 4
LKKIETILEKNENKCESIDIWKIIMKAFWKEILISCLMFFPYSATRIAQPLLLKQIVLNINDSNLPSYEGYLYAIGLGLSIFFQAIIHHLLYFRTERIGTQVRIALSAIIYKRLLSLPTRSIMKTTTVQIINLISNDIRKFEELSKPFHLTWVTPMEALIIFALIWNQIGIPTLFGYGVLLLLIPLQIFFSKHFGIYRKIMVQ